MLPQGPTLSMSLGPGQSLCVVGPGGAGKSRFLRTVADEERPAQGTAIVLGDIAVASSDDFTRRTTPQALARKHSGSRKAGGATDALVAAKLWDVRQQPLTTLSPSQRAACELLPCLASDAGLLLIDGQLDRIDPWALSGVMEHLRSRAASGSAIIAVTNRPDLVSLCDLVLVLQNSQARFAGRVQDLLISGPDSEIEVVTDSQPGVRALVEPFKISVRKTDSGLVLRATEGQQIAARLLVEGYGDVKFVVLKQPTVEESLIKLVK